MLNKLGIYQEEMVLIASQSLGEIYNQEDLIGKEIFMWTEGCPYRAALEEWLKLKNISLLSPVLPVTPPLLGVSVRVLAWR